MSNYYLDSTANKGIGKVDYVDTSCEVHETTSGCKYFDTSKPLAGQSSKPSKGVTKTNHNRTDDPLGADAGKLSMAASAEAFSNGEIVDALNKGEGSYKNWQQGANSPVHSVTPVTYKLTITGKVKTDYVLGEELDLSGAGFILNFSDGTTKNINADNIQVKGYDKKKHGVQNVKLVYGEASIEIQVTVLKPESGKIKVTLSILGDKVHDEGDGVHTMAGNNLEPWINNQEYEVDVNATVRELLETAMSEAGMNYVNPTGNYITQVTYKDVTIGEQTNGATSGWMFAVNGVHGEFAINQQYMEPGDVIVFHYTDDYTLENRGSADVVKVMEMIDALPAVEELSLMEAEAVARAQDAFRKLSKEDQAQISADRREKLEASVLKIALLRKEKQEAFENIYKKTAEYLSGLADQYTIQAGTEGGEWMVIGLARSGKLTEKQAADYYANVEKFVKENINEKEQLHRSKSTENSRVILGLTAIGKDVTDVDGHNLLAGLSDLTYLKRQGINGPIWALIALDSHGYEIPALVGAGTQTTRENLVETILAAQLADGGWALAGTEADADVTAMAIQALAPYYESNSKVREAVDTAVDKLSHMQNPDGSYTSSGTTNAEACVQVIVALTALGIDPVTDSRFTKNGNSVMDALLGFYVGNGGFAHTTGGTINGMATEQAYYAMAAYSRMMSGQNSLYDMSDVAIAKTPAADQNQPEKNPSKDSDKSQNKAKPISPQTGDEQSDMYVFLMMLGFAAGIAGLAFGKKRRAL